jgi:hypothetical protein
MGRRLLVPDKDVLDAALLEQRVIDRQHRAAGIAEHDLYTQVRQGLDQDIGSTHFSWHHSQPCWNGAAKDIKI